MNLELDVLRLANEDVIATSTAEICTEHPTAMHLYVSNVNCDGNESVARIFDIDGSFGSDTCTDEISESVSDMNWYYYDDGWKLCTGSHQNLNISNFNGLGHNEHGS